MSQNELSLEINTAEIDAIAAELDAQAEEPIKPKSTRKKATKKVAAEPKTEGPQAEPTPVVDEEFKAMIIHGVGQGIDFMKDSLELMEPGDTVRVNVGKCVARLLERIKPMEAGPVSDVVQIVGYLGLWALTGREWGKKTDEQKEVRNVTPQ